MPEKITLSRESNNHKQPPPFRQFILKITNKCNLACDYCHLVPHGNSTTHPRPPIMAHHTFHQTAQRIAEYAKRHLLKQVDIVFHGGEPLLIGHTQLASYLRLLRDYVDQTTHIRFGLQTNGVLLNTEYLELFRHWNVHVGVSLDGHDSAHNRHRRYPTGRGSYQTIASSLRAINLPRYRHLRAGILAVVDPHNDPIHTYEGLIAHQTPSIDFLLPHTTVPAPTPTSPSLTKPAPYGQWLIQVFDRWYDAPRRESRVRLFEEIMNMLLGGTSTVISIGVSPQIALIIDINGFIYESSITSGPPFPASPLHIDTHTFDQAILLPGIVSRHRGIDGLCRTCQACELRRICGGGLYAHRYHPSNGCDNPSLYCPDLSLLIRHIKNRMSADIKLQPPAPV